MLSGRAAGYLLGLLKCSIPPPPEVTTPTERRIDGVMGRRSRHINRRDGTTFRGIPITTVPRTLVDLAADLSLDDLARACHEAGVRYGTTPKQVEVVLARRPTSRGAANLRKILRGEVRVTLSKLERVFLALLREARLPLPKTNRLTDGRRVDCRWPEHRLTVELDSYRFHTHATRGSRTAAANASRAPGATSSAATRTATSSRTRGTCSRSCARFFR